MRFQFIYGLVLIPTLVWAQNTKFSADPNVEFAVNPLEWERDYTYQRTAIVRYPYEGDSVYSEAAEDFLVKELQKNGRWTVLSTDDVAFTLDRDMITAKPGPYPEKLIKSWAQEWDVDSIWVVSANKLAKTIELELKLWNARTDSYWLKWSEIYPAETTLEPTKKNTKQAFQTLSSQLPFDGEVLSRNDRRITINIGKLAGLKKDQIVIITKIHAMKRDPIQNTVPEIFLKEVGQVEITAVEEDLAFAQIIKEDQDNPVLVHHKVVIPEEPSQDPRVRARMDSKMADVAFGKNAYAWRPRRKPNLGYLDLVIGIGSVLVNDTPAGSNTASQRSNFVPSVRLRGEIWISKYFFMKAYLQQTLLGLSEDSGGNPLSLNSSTTGIGFAPGFRYLVTNSLKGPQIRFLLGYDRFAFYTDFGGNATSLTSKTYQGFTLFSDLIIPIKNDWGVGLGFSRTFFTSLSESPQTSGESSDNVAWTFFLNGFYRLSERWRIVSSLRFGSYSSIFSGTGTRATASTSTSIKDFHVQSGIGFSF